MEWIDTALVLGSRRLGEADALVELMTRDHGRHLGVVKGGRSKRWAAALQIGNRVRAVWRARLDEHVGTWTVEPLDGRAAELMASAVALNGVQTLAAHLRLLPERDPHPELFEAMAAIVDHLGEPRLAGELIVRFELAVIEALGFGLDLSACALTGATEDLAWVSPKSGRAATRAAGAPHAARLLALPAFLVGAASGEPANWGRAGIDDLLAGFRLTGHFLARHVWEPRGLNPPTTREGLVSALTRGLVNDAG
ncbi:MAG: DNA repair protein RecO [Siculibacillus sp.]|nr:DNA repair protein RecO [Siculibacillus sp.]